MQVVDALHAQGSCFSLRDYRKQKRSENADDGDDRQQFNQSKAVSIGISHIDWTAALLGRHDFFITEVAQSVS